MQESRRSDKQQYTNDDTCGDKVLNGFAQFFTSRPMRVVVSSLLLAWTTDAFILFNTLYYLSPQTYNVLYSRKPETPNIGLPLTILWGALDYTIRYRTQDRHSVFSVTVDFLGKTIFEPADKMLTLANQKILQPAKNFVTASIANFDYNYYSNLSVRDCLYSVHDRLPSRETVARKASATLKYITQCPGNLWKRIHTGKKDSENSNEPKRRNIV